MGFCFYDTDNYGSDDPARYAPSSGACAGGVSAASTTMGLSVGWGDLYARSLPDQYIDITGLTSGRYRLTLIADKDNWFLEGSNSNNVSWIDIQLKANKVTIVAYGPGV